MQPGRTHAGRGFEVATQPGACASSVNVPPQRSHMRRAPSLPVSSLTRRRLRAQPERDHEYLEPGEALLVISELGRDIQPLSAGGQLAPDI